MRFLRRFLEAQSGFVVLYSIIAGVVLGPLVTATAQISNLYAGDTVDYTSLNPGLLLPRQIPDDTEISDTGRCGNLTKEGGGMRCPKTKDEQVRFEWGRTGLAKGNEARCCSSDGFCGGTMVHCGKGCQPGFGSCGPKPNITDLNCGPSYNNQICPGTHKCCSPAGFCGNTEDYCKSPDCLRGFGECDHGIVPQGTNTSSVERPLLVPLELNGVDVGYGVNIFRCQTPGDVALTYDDGPYNFTTELLDILDQNGFKATFFVTGVNQAKGPIDDPKYGWDKIITRMHQSGHQIGSHTWSHADLDELNVRDMRDEMIKLEMALRNILGFFPTYMRPPYSSCTNTTGCIDTIRSLGYYIILFSLDTADYFHTSPTTIQKSKDIFAQALSPGNSTPAKDAHLVIAHDLSWQSAVNLTGFMVQEMVKMGWRGVTVGECLGDKEGVGWYRTENGKAPGDAGGNNGTGGGQDGGDKSSGGATVGFKIGGEAGRRRRELAVVVGWAVMVALGVRFLGL